MDSKKQSVAIIGAGITGLPIALEFCKQNFQVTVLEKNHFVGGVATSILNNGYVIDIGPHYVTLPNESDITDEINELLGKENIIILPSSIRNSRKAFFRNKMWDEFPSIGQLVKSLNFTSKINFGIEFFIIKILSCLGKYKGETTENYLVSNYGRFLYNNWFQPYYDNLYHNVDIPKKHVENKFPPLTFQKMLKLFKKTKKTKNPISINSPKYFNCYFKGGMISLIQSIKEKIENKGGKIITNANIKEIYHEGKKKIIFSVDELQQEIDVDLIIYAMPLTIAKKWFNTKLQQKEETSSLNSIMVFLFIDKKLVFNNWIIDVFDKKINSWRISQQSYLSNSIAPKNKSLLNIEIRAKDEDSIWKLNDEDVYKIVCRELEQLKILNLEKIEGYKIIKLRNVYPVNIKNNSEKEIKNLINSFENEYAFGIEIDSVTLHKDDEDNELENMPRLGGIFGAMRNAKNLVHKITN